MLVEKNAPLQTCNTFGIAARAQALVRVRSAQDVQNVLTHPTLARAGLFVLGGGSNIVLTGDVSATVLKMEIKGRRLLHESDTQWVVEAGAGESWHDTVAWTLAQGWPGLENLALIPGTVGAAPVQNIGAYGCEVKETIRSVEMCSTDTCTDRGSSISKIRSIQVCSSNSRRLYSKTWNERKRPHQERSSNP